MERARAAGVEGGELWVGNGLFRVWPMMYNYIPEAGRTLDELAAFIKERVPRASAASFPVCKCPAREKFLID